MTEMIGTKGRYVAKCVGPVEAHRARYVILRDRIAVLEAERDSTITKSARDKVRAALAPLYVEYDAIPMERKWADTINNLMTTVGKNLTLDTILAGSGFTATVVMGLKGTGSAAAGDTQASHAGWSEVGGANAPVYTGNRKTPSFSAASAGSKATSAAVAFAITSAGTAAGCFININGSATKDNTTGTLLTAGDFAGGNKVVDNGDTLNVSYSLGLT